MENWYNFKNGVKIPDYEINSWLNEVKEKLKNGEDNYNISSGDTTVVGLKFSENSFQFIVATSDGVQRINCLDFKPYKRNHVNG